MKESIVKPLDCSPNNSRKRCLTHKNTHTFVHKSLHALLLWQLSEQLSFTPR